MLTVNKATFYLNKENIESFRSQYKFHGGIHDQNVVGIV